MTITEVTDDLFVGDIDDVRSGDTSPYECIVSVCQDEVSDNVSDDVTYRHIPLSDGEPDTDSHVPGQFDEQTIVECIDTVRDCWPESKTVVHCHMGRSRSPSIAAAAMALEDEIRFEEALGRVHDTRYVQPGSDMFFLVREVVRDAR